MNAAAPSYEPAEDRDTADRNRRDRDMARWRKRSVLIRRLRRVLPAAMGALVALLLVWVGVRGVLSALNAASGAVGTVHMTNMRFHGRDGHDRSFIINAHDAVRDGADINKIELVLPHFEIAGDAGHGPQTMSGRQGVYLSEQKMLYMSGNVVFEDGKGARFVSDRAVLNIADGSVRGDSAVKGDSPLGHIEASSYSVDGHGEHTIFTGNVRGHLVNQQEQAR